MQKYTKINKSILLLFFVLALLSLTSCVKKAKSDNEIRQDIENHQQWKKYCVAVTSFKVEKRQTNQDSKEDFVYITMVGENEVYTVEQHYIATYHLYNEGWILDELVENYDDQHQIIATPLKGVDYNDVQEVIDYTEFSDFISYPDSSWSIDSTWEAQEVELTLSDNYGYNLYTLNYNIHYFGWFDENLIIPIVFNFQYLGPDVGYDWLGYIDEYSIVRDVKLHDGIIGKWIDASWESPFYATVTFSNRQGNRCWCDFSCFTYNGSIYLNGGKSFSGWVSLDFELNSSSKKLSKVCLESEDGSGIFTNLNSYWLQMEQHELANRDLRTWKALEFSHSGH